MIKKYTKLLDFRRAFADFSLRARDVFAILSASRIRAVHRRDERKRALDAVVLHLPQRLCEHRMPVAIPPIDRQLRATSRKFGLREFVFDRRDQIAGLLVDRAFAVEVVVVLGDGQHALARDVAPRSTFSRKGITSSCFSGPPNETTRIAS